MLFAFKKKTASHASSDRNRRISSCSAAMRLCWCCFVSCARNTRISAARSLGLGGARSSWFYSSRSLARGAGPVQSSAVCYGPGDRSPATPSQSGHGDSGKSEPKSAEGRRQRARRDARVTERCERRGVREPRPVTEARTRNEVMRGATDVFSRVHVALTNLGGCNDHHHSMSSVERYPIWGGVLL